MSRSNVISTSVLATVVCVIATSGFAQVSDRTTMNGHILPGYQGWFYCPGDGNDPVVGWRHWSKSSTSIGPNQFSTDLWPDITEYASVFTATGVTLLDGTTGSLFSSITQSTNNKHFEWMRTYGIDGVFLQRFLSELGDPTFFAARNQVMQNVRSAANTYGRTFSIEYDISGSAESTLYQNLTNDWIYLSNTYNIRNDPRYQYHNGKPVITIWGLGFNDRPGTPTIANQIINFFKNDPTYGGCFCVGGVPGAWRTLGAPSKTDSAWNNTYRSWHCINPWTVGGYRTSTDITNWKNNVAGPDVTLCNSLGIVYLPVAWPGFSWDNLMNLPPGTSGIDRRNGQHYWDQAYAYESLSGVNKLFVAMFDECDEGTAIFKISDNVPNTNHWVGNNGYPREWWMRLAGSSGQMARGEIPLSGTIQISPFTCNSGDASIDLGSPDVANLMTAIVGGDGNTTPATIGGRACRKNVNPSSDFYFYFGVDDGYVFQGNHPAITICVDYYDTGTGSLTLEYDSNTGNTLSDFYRNGGSVTLTNTNTWKTKTFHVTNAYFGNRENGGADFRVSNVGNTFYIDIVQVDGGVLPTPGQATSPNPANTANNISTSATLSWTAGGNASSHDVYFGTSSPGTFRGNQPGTTYSPGTLNSGTTYFWRIDEKNASGTTTGIVWSFTTLPLPGVASAPNPANAATGVSITATLSWTAGGNASSHDVYFGTSSPGTFRGNQPDTTYSPGTLNSGTTYFWRIDEKNASGTTTGIVWSFTTLPLPGVASAPNPANAATGVSITATLSWTAGSNTASHDVRFGSSNPPPFIGNQAGTSYAPGTMAANTVYYWRIDEKNSSGTTTGTVWSFTTLTANSPPTVGSNATISSSCLKTDNATVYYVTVNATDPDGPNDFGGSNYGILCMMSQVINSWTNARGYFGWHPTQNPPGAYTADAGECGSGGGYVGKYPSSFGYQYVTLIPSLCSTTTSGNTRFVTFAFTCATTYGTLDSMDIHTYAEDTANHDAGWINSDVNFQSGPPTISNLTCTSGQVPSTWTNNQAFNFTFSSSGATSYEYKWDASPTASGTGTVCTSPLSFNSGDVSANYIHVRAAGSCAGYSTLGPYMVDVTAPTLGTSPGPSVSQASLCADGSTQYTVSYNATDSGSGLRAMLMLFNYDGSTQTHSRGYVSWGLNSGDETYYGHTSQGAASGGGFWGYYTGGVHGSTYINPVSCSTSLSGSTRTTTWTFKVNTSWGVDGPNTGNFISMYAVDQPRNVSNSGWSFSNNAPFNYTFAIPNCDDGNVCTADSCSNGVCQHAPICNALHPIAWRSMRNHANIGDVPIALNATATGNNPVSSGGPSIETRGTVSTGGVGITRIQVDFDGSASAPNASAISVTGYTTTYPGGTATLGSPTGYAVATATMIDTDTLEMIFSPALPDQSCFAISLGLNTVAETVDQSGDHDVVVRALNADANVGGTITNADILLTKSKFSSGVILDTGANVGNAIYDYNLSGTITNADVLYCKAQFNAQAYTRSALCP